MTGMTDKSSNMLAKIGITIGKGNKLELDEDALKKSDISSLQSIFTGYNSYAGSGSYSNTLSKLVPSTVDERVGDKDKSSDTSSKTTEK